MLPESIHALWLRFKALFRRRQLDRDLEDELHFHLAMREQKLAASGVPPEEAPHAARRQFGNATHANEVNRELWTFPLLGSLWQDVRYGARSLGHNRGSAAAIVLLLALGIGGATALFGPLYSLVLSPLPFPHPDRLVRIGGNIPIFNVYAQRFVHPERLKPIFTAVATYETGTVDISSGASGLELVQTAAVTPGFFATFGVEPRIGSDFNGVDPDAHVGVISDRFWRRELRASPDVIGSSLKHGTTNMVVLGVMPPGFDFPSGTDVWVLKNPGGNVPDPLLGRLRPGLSLDEAVVKLEGAGFKPGIPGHASGIDGSPGPVLESFQTYLLGDRGPLLWTLWAVSLLFLLLSCAGAANLLLARGARRQPEMVVRLTLGAGRGRLIRQLLAETLLLAAAGGLLGLGLAAAGARWISMHLPTAQGAGPFSLAGLGLVVLLAMVAAILCGLAPAFHATGGDLNTFLKTGTSGITRSTHRRRFFGSHELLAGSQLVLATVLLIATGLLLRSLIAHLSVPLGFDPRDVAVIKVHFPPRGPAGGEGDARVRTRAPPRRGAPRTPGNPAST